MRLFDGERRFSFRRLIIRCGAALLAPGDAAPELHFSVIYDDASSRIGRDATTARDSARRPRDDCGLALVREAPTWQVFWGLKVQLIRKAHRECILFSPSGQSQIMYSMGFPILSLFHLLVACQRGIYIVVASHLQVI